MSTYNGCEYLREQIDSILNQVDVDVLLCIRDDGSSDDTCEILRHYARKYPDRVECYYGENVGVAESFLNLAKATCGRAQWYAFADQDDIWLPDKLSAALQQLAGRSNKAGALYASTTLICDERLCLLGRNTFPRLRFTIGSEMCRHRLAGHTMVFSDVLCDAFAEMPTSMGFSHDHALCLLACARGASFVLDGNGYALHRRLKQSETPGGNGIRKRLRHELDLISNRYGLDRRAMAAYLSGRYGASLRDDDAVLLLDIALGATGRLLFSNRLDCGLLFGNVETKAALAIGRFYAGTNGE